MLNQMAALMLNGRVASAGPRSAQQNSRTSYVGEAAKVPDLRHRYVLQKLVATVIPLHIILYLFSNPAIRPATAIG